MKTVFLMCFLTLAATCHSRNENLDDVWEKYKKIFEKDYGSKEDEHRTIWEKNIKLIADHNFGTDLGKHTFYTGINKFADMSPEMFRQRVLSDSLKPLHLGSYCNGTEIPVPDSIDWRQRGFNLPVQDQGQDGSTLLFSLVEAFEGQYWMDEGKLTRFSIPNLKDCASNCSARINPQCYYNYIKEHGINDVASYPKPGCSNGCCFNPDGLVAYCKGTCFTQKGSEDALKQAVAIAGPVAVAIDASSFAFQLYDSGIYDDPSCSKSTPDHTLLIVGYGTQNGVDYWICKNSWGANWGMHGYINIVRNKNMCGIANYAFYPLM